jgi:hypothetical protein
MSNDDTTFDLAGLPRIGSEAGKMRALSAGCAGGWCSGGQWINNRMFCLVVAWLMALFRCLLLECVAFLKGGEGVSICAARRDYVTDLVAGNFLQCLRALPPQGKSLAHKQKTGRPDFLAL